MTESSITVCVRIRPFSSSEQALLAPTDNYVPFLGDGGLSGGSPAKPYFPADEGSGPSRHVLNSTHLRPKLLRSIVTPVDDKVLIFDPPDNNPLTRLLTTSAYAPGAKRHKDVRYAFDRVFDDTCGQYTVFEGTMKPLLDGVLNGYNASVFAYGATGCGKTHTISGTPDDPGVIFLTMKDLYQRIEDMASEIDVDIRVSYLEIYNETIRDLLSVNPTPAGQGLALRKDAANKISVIGITEHVPTSPEGVLDLLMEGNKRRTMSPTEANAVSSRSHAVLQVNVTQRPRTADTVAETTSASLNIIDLAGSERAAATRNNGARMKEGANINKSLLALGNCINALCVTDGRGKHVPYRNSKLTRLLEFSLGGNCRTVMIVCVSPSSAHYEETHNTLKYANQAKNIRTKVSRNMLNVDRHVAQYVQAIHELREEVAELKSKLSERGILESTGMKRRRAEVRREVEDAKRRMAENIAGVRRLMEERAAAEAELDGAEAQLGPARARLAEIEAALRRDLDAVRAQGPAAEAQYEAPPDLVSERDLLRAMILTPAERRLADNTLLDAKRSVANSVHAAHGCIVAAANNSKFQPPPPPAAVPAAVAADGTQLPGDAPTVPQYDPEAGPEKPAAEEVRNVGERLYAELERDRYQALYRASVAARESDARKMCGLSSIVARTHSVLGELVGRLEQGVGSDLTEANAALIDQLKAVLSQNESSFVELAGIKLELNFGPSSGSLVSGAMLRSSTSSNASSTSAAASGAHRSRPSHGRRGRISLLGAPRTAVAIPASIEEAESPTTPVAALPSVGHVQAPSIPIRRVSTQVAHRPAQGERKISASGHGATASAVPAYMRATASSSAQSRRRSSLSSHAVSRMTRAGRPSNLAAHHGSQHGSSSDSGTAPNSPRRGGAQGPVGRGPPPAGMRGPSANGVGASTMSTRRAVSKPVTGAAPAAGTRRASVQVPSTTATGSRRGPVEAAGPAKKVKAFRWADEAGEGVLDDQGRGLMPFASSTLQGSAAEPSGVNLSTIDVSSSSSPRPASPLKGKGLVHRRLTGLHPPAEIAAALASTEADMSMASSASTAEWEDVVPTPVMPASATLAPVVNAPAPRRSARASVAKGSARGGGNIFNKAFLATSKGGAPRSSDIGDEDEEIENLSATMQTSNPRRSSGGPRDPFGELGNSSMSSDSDFLMNLDLNKLIVPDSTTKAAPYRRDANVGGGASTTGSIGPVRRSKRRSSAGVGLQALESSTSSSSSSPSSAPSGSSSSPTARQAHVSTSTPSVAPPSTSALAPASTNARPLSHVPVYAAAKVLSSPRKKASSGTAAAVAALAKAGRA